MPGIQPLIIKSQSLKLEIQKNFFKLNNSFNQSLSNFLKLAFKKGFKSKLASKQESLTYISCILFGQNSKNEPHSSALFYKPSAKIKRSSSWVWIEIKNSKGKPGWLYGQSEFVVFELPKEYLFVTRKSLVDLVHKKINFNEPMVGDSWGARYRILQRSNAFDQITQVKLDDLKSLPSIYIWNKE